GTPSTAGGTGNGNTSSTASTSTAASTSGEATRVPARSASARSVATVAAADARAITVARIGFVKSRLRTARTLGASVTIRNVHARPVRDAVVVLRAVPGARNTLTGSLMKFSSRVGRADFAVAVPTRLLGKRLRFLVSARTPRSQALKLASVRLPAVGHTERTI